MYPDFQYIAERISGASMPEWLGTIKTFGFFVAMAFLIASYLLAAELKRKEQLGLLKAEKSAGKNNAGKLIYPHERVSNIVMLAVVGGFIGAKVFNAFETWQDFLSDPIGNLFSGAGLTFYGGLLVAAVLIIYYLRKYKIDIRHFADAIAPALMLAYGIGRLGCHFSGDGDWGIFNSAYVTLPDASLHLGMPGGYNQALHNNADYFNANFNAASEIRNLFVPAPGWLPEWLIANNFPHNVINEGIKIINCDGKYCNVLPVGVFPTSLYEAIASMILFGLLWGIRKRFETPLHLFGLYLILNGVERFIIEKIRVNYKYDWGFIHPTQSEIISFFLITTGVVILIFYRASGLSFKIKKQK